MARLWSQLVSDRYQLRLPADVVTWLDQGIWQQRGGAEFHEPLTPEQLLDPAPGTIWASFMLPDTLPLICNGYGDWLCLRVTPASEIAEIIFWTHDGGDWIPFGDNLAEALVFDAAVAVLYPPRPEFDDPPPPHEQQFRYAEWGRRWLLQANKKVSAFWQNEATGNDHVLNDLIANNVARTAARRNLILDHLDTKLKTVSSAKVAKQIGLPWQPDYVSWLFDASLMPAERRTQLSRHFNIAEEELATQDWGTAETQALEVLKQRHDLGWAHDIAGWAAERRGDINRAIGFYREGVRPSLFSDNTVKFRTHWFANGFGKFSAARLSALRDQVPREVLDDPYLQVYLANDNETLRERIRDYWLAQARAAEKAGRHAEAYHAYYNAGWDMGLRNMDDFPMIFDGLKGSAKAAGFKGLAAIAELHGGFL
jgi:hypothetical protein